ncbi:MAG: gamma carbonic anhydrase family protein [Candidatus Bathyarchaeia archaeon]
MGKIKKDLSVNVSLCCNWWDCLQGFSGIRPFRGKKLLVDGQVFIDPSAVIIGDVFIGDKSSVWPNAVIRGDFASIKIGKYTAIQESVVIHSGVRPINDEFKPTPVTIGDYCIIGHGAIVHCSEIGSYTLVGMNAVLGQGARIGEGCIIGMGSIVPEDKVIPPKSLVVGVGQIIRTFDNKIYENVKRNAEFYSRLAQECLPLFKPI